MRFDIITIFPEMFRTPFAEGMIRRSCENGIVDIGVHDLRDYTVGRHRVTDDYPYGGGAGMVMKPEPVIRALNHIKSTAKGAHTLLMTPQGRTFNQGMAGELSRMEHLILICGRYEGIDERVRENYVDSEVSIGDYVLSGGEFPAMVVVEAVTRLLPGALGNAESVANDSFSGGHGFLEYPQYTRPREYMGHEVPEILLSGDHKRIEQWRHDQAIRRTKERRPDLIEEKDGRNENG
ncbi:tRNA (guanosine(37)-N1)-methyltransferase TrmD [Thermodesulfobacteriota bacterium]